MGKQEEKIRADLYVGNVILYVPLGAGSTGVPLTLESTAAQTNAIIVQENRNNGEMRSHVNLGVR